jgi:hypothetical protein
MKQVSKKTGIELDVVRIIIKRFFWAFGQGLRKNKDIDLRGYFSMSMTKRMRNKVKSEDHKLWNQKHNRRMTKNKKLKNKK